MRKGDHLEDSGVHRWIILKQIFEKQAGVGACAESNWLRIRKGGSCECGNEPSGYIKCMAFLV
jgi:hypothetical protein